jgi:hypothetical protein
MVRSIWKSTLTISIACAGLTLAQAPAVQRPEPDSGAAKASQQFVTIAERGRPAQRCKLLGSWKTADGATAYKVQAADTGELMTVVESTPSSSGTGKKSRAIAMRIFRWGKNNKPPEGAPIEPANSASNSLPQASQKRTTASTKPSIATPPRQLAAARPSGPGEKQAGTMIAGKPPAVTSPEIFPPAKKKKNDSSTDLERHMSEFPLLSKEAKAGSEKRAQPVPIPIAESALARQASEFPLVTPPALKTPPSAAEVASQLSSNPKAHRSEESMPVPVVTIPDPRPIEMEGVATKSASIRAPKNRTSSREPMATRDQGLPIFDANLPNAFSSSSPKQTSRVDSNAFTPPLPDSHDQGMMMNGAMAYSANGMVAMAGSFGNNMMAAQGYYQAYGNEMMVPYQMAASGFGPPVMQMGYTLPLPPEAEYWVCVLHDSLYPSQREWAAESLTAFDWRSFSALIDPMVTAAREDPSATVRAACVRCFARMHVNRPDVLATITALKNDTDPRVQHEAEEAFVTLAPAGTK